MTDFFSKNFVHNGNGFGTTLVERVPCLLPCIITKSQDKKGFKIFIIQQTEINTEINTPTYIII